MPEVRLHEPNRHGDGRDQGGADVLQKQEHDDEDQADRLDQRPHHLLDGDPDEGGGVVGVDDPHPRGKVLLQFGHLGLDPVAGLQGVGAGGEADRHPSQRLRITSYNVCYTKLLRAAVELRGADQAAGIETENKAEELRRDAA